ncbi:MAG: septal ring lytic transglycosylase RlpA family protein [Gammaproteobacteria bacterium]|nr:septal ring lytic transglycosylase RlpA family protein [Gammaproteobacteria bacterium]
MSQPIKTCAALLIFALALTACSSSPKKGNGTFKRPTASDGAPNRSVDIASIPNAVPKREPRSKYGNPKSYVVFGKRYHVLNSNKGFVQRGVASWYGTKFHGKRTSSGEPYNMFAMTAAHKTLPLPTYVEVTNLDNGRKVIVKVNDRGPFVAGRIIDLSHTAAKKLNIIGSGTGRVEIRAIAPGRYGKSVKKPPLQKKVQKKPSRVSASRPKTPKASVTPANERLFVQIGAFNNSHNAENMQKNLYQRLGPRLRIDAHYSETEKLYRVRIGPISSRDDADRVHTKLKRIGFPSSRIISEPPR